MPLGKRDLDERLRVVPSQSADTRAPGRRAAERAAAARAQRTAHEHGVHVLEGRDAPERGLLDDHVLRPEFTGLGAAVGASSPATRPPVAVVRTEALEMLLHAVLVEARRDFEDRLVDVGAH